MTKDFITKEAEYLFNVLKVFIGDDRKISGAPVYEVTDEEMEKDKIFLLVSWELAEDTLQKENHLFFHLRTETDFFTSAVIYESEITREKIMEVLMEMNLYISYFHIYKKRCFLESVYISKKWADFLESLLSEEPKTKEECLSEDDTISKTVTFENGKIMDIKCCGVQFHEGESNLPWTEAVLFSRNGSEICCTEISDSFLGEWICETKDAVYIALVKVME